MKIITFYKFEIMKVRHNKFITIRFYKKIHIFQFFYKEKLRKQKDYERKIHLNLTLL